MAHRRRKAPLGCLGAFTCWAWQDWQACIVAEDTPEPVDESLLADGLDVEDAEALNLTVSEELVDDEGSLQPCMQHCNAVQLRWKD
eukprot:5189327-Amphidinium_carterae.1